MTRDDQTRLLIEVLDDLTSAADYLAAANIDVPPALRRAITALTNELGKRRRGEPPSAFRPPGQS